MAAATADILWAVGQNRTARPAQNFIKGELQCPGPLPIKPSRSARRSRVFTAPSDIPNTATFWHRGSAKMGAWDGSQKK